MNLLDAFKQYIKDAMPGGALNPEVSTQGVLDTAALATTPVPFLGDAIGLAADVRRLAKNPEERTPANFGLAALGALPFVPAGMFIGKGSKMWDALAAEKAQQMAAKGVDDRKIFRETNTYRSPDGHWKQEIDDSSAKLRDYQYTPQEAYKNAKETAWINEDVAAAGRVRQMQPYAVMSKNQLKDEYRRTGGEIVDAAIAGDKAKALQLQEGRAGLDYLMSAMSDRRYGPASAYLSHGDLGKAYPDVYKLHTRIDGDADSLGAYLRAEPGRGEQMVLKNKPMWSENKSTMLHELQHAIQQREGWAMGGGPELFSQQDVAVKARDMLNWQREVAAQMKKNPSLDWKSAEALAAKEYEAIGWPEAIPSAEIRKMAQNPLQYFESQPEDFVKLYGLDKRTTPYTPHEAYQRLAGEAEARATQARMNMNAAQRREVFPLDSYDVPIDQLIIRGGLLDGPAMSIPKPPQADALETARKNAVTMLGLPPNNTPMDRANALGFDMEGVHFSRHGIDATELDSGKYAVAPFDAVGTHIGTKDAALDRFRNTVGTTDQIKGSTYPVLIKRGEQFVSPKTGGAWAEDDLSAALFERGGYANAKETFQSLNQKLRRDLFRGSGYDSIPYVNDVEAKGAVSYIVPPQNIRSRFAAFDPARINENDLLGRADLGLLGLLAGGAAGAAYLTSDKDR